MKKLVLVAVFGLTILASCGSDDVDLFNPNEEENPVIHISKDTIVSLQNDFSAICYLESGKRYTLDVEDYSIQIDTSRVLISLINDSNAITINDYFSSKDKRHVAPDAFNKVLTDLGKLSNEYIGLGSNNFVFTHKYYVLNDNYQVQFYRYLFGASKNSVYSNLDSRKVKFGSPASYTLVDRKTFANNYKEYISDVTEDGTWEFNSGYKVFFNEPGYIICAFRTSTGVTQNGTVLGSHVYILRYKIYDNII